MIHIDQLIFSEVDVDAIPIQVFFYYSLDIKEMDEFLAYEVEDDVYPEDETIEFVEIILYLFSSSDFKLEFALHGKKETYFTTYIEHTSEADEYLKIIPKWEKQKLFEKLTIMLS